MSKNAWIKIGMICLVFLLALSCVAQYIWHQTNTSEIVFNKCIDSIVEVKATTEDVGESFGTGVILTEDGKVVTNAHVVSYDEYGEQKTFNSVQIRFSNKDEYEDCIVVKIDYEEDLAILKITTEQEYSAIKTSAKSCKFGERVFAIGNTSNYGLGISEGIISVPSVNITYEEKARTVIQADLNVSSGNSGGALINQKGELIGIITFRTKDNNGKINYGFVYSIPTEQVLSFLQE